MTMATIFMAQVSGVHLSMSQTLSILGLLLLTSKGAAAVTGGGFITLAATLSAIPAIPVAGLALLVGVDRFMSAARALTNLIGNAVATVVVARWDGALDMNRARMVLDGDAGSELPDEVLAPPDPIFVTPTYAPSERS
jgi:aerobic C4-dicarboxylate transport protein